MRPVHASIVLLTVAVACAPAEKPAADTSAVTMAPAPLTEAEIAGTWTGTATMEGSDSANVHWTQVCAGGACAGTAQEAPDTVRSTYRLEGDSAIGATQPYVDPTVGGSKVIDNWVLRVTGSSLSGRGWYVLADKPDSVLARYTFEGTRK